MGILGVRGGEFWVIVIWELSASRRTADQAHEAVDFIGVYVDPSVCQNDSKKAKMHLNLMSKHPSASRLNEQKHRASFDHFVRFTICVRLNDKELVESQVRKRWLEKSGQPWDWRIVLERLLDGNNF